MAANLEITCPCCESLLVIDRVSGEILVHKKKESKSGLSLEAMVANLDSQKSELAKKFDKGIESQKDRARILEERFKEAMKKAESSDEKYVNPMDID